MMENKNTNEASKECPVICLQDIGKEEPHILGGVVVTEDIFQQMVTTEGQNTEFSVEKGTYEGSILCTFKITGEMPIMVLKRRVSDTGDEGEIIGGEMYFKGKQTYVSERGVFGVYAGVMHSYLFPYAVSVKMVEVFKNLQADIKPTAGA